MLTHTCINKKHKTEAINIETPILVRKIIVNMENVNMTVKNVREILYVNMTV